MGPKKYCCVWVYIFHSSFCFVKDCKLLQFKWFPLSRKILFGHNCKRTITHPTLGATLKCIYSSKTHKTHSGTIQKVGLKVHFDCLWKTPHQLNNHTWWALYSLDCEWFYDRLFDKSRQRVFTIYYWRPLPTLRGF